MAYIAASRSTPAHVMAGWGAVAAVYLMLTAVIPAEVTTLITAMVLLGVISYRHGRVERTVIWLALPFALLIAIGLLAARGNPPVAILRDAWYVLRVAGIIAVGYWTAGHIGLRRLLELVIGSGVVVSLWQLGQIAVDPSVLAENVREARGELGSGHFGIPMALGVCSVVHRFGWERRIWFVNYQLPLLLVLTTAVIVTFSRSQLIAAAIITCTMYGAFVRFNLRTITAGATMVGAFLVILATTPASEMGGSDITLRGKFARTFTEIAVEDQTDRSDINRDWRGFETYKALQTYLEGTTKEKVVGRGLGTAIDLGFEMKLGGGTFEEITKLHNGYAFLLVKTGPLGLAVVGSLFLVLLIAAARYSVIARDVDSLAAARLMAGATWVLVLTTLVIGGLLNGASMVPVQFLLGCSIALLGRDGRG